MPTATYDLIEEKVLGSAQASVTFSSIPGTYKDLVVECLIQTSVTADVYLRFNADTATNYSATYVAGNGTSAISGRQTSVSAAYVDVYGYPTSTNFDTTFIQVFNYTSTNVYKTSLCRVGGAGLGTSATVHLWRKTPEAVTSLTLGPGSGNFNTNCVFRLWGVSG